MREYVTSEEYLPETSHEEVTVQVTDKETKEIFTTRAKVAKRPDELSDPAPLTVVRGPHENIEEQWYIEVLTTNVDGPAVDRDLLQECVRRSRERTNIVNARSEDLRSLLLYLVETGEYRSVSEGVRELLLDHLAEEHSDLLDAYVDVRAELDREDLASALGSDER